MRVQLGALRALESNAKAHNVEKIVRSIRDFGVQAPISIAADGMTIVAGHGRLKALRLMRDRGEPAPRGVEEQDGDWLVPVYSGGLELGEAKRYAPVDNRLTEIGGWDEAKLVQLDPAEFGEWWDLAKMDDIVPEPEIDPITPDGRDDVVPEAPRKPVTEVGDVWELGRNLLVCGDSTVPESYAAIGAVDCVITDPPFAIYGSSSGITSSVADDRMVVPFFESVMRAIATRLRHFGHAYVFCDWRSWASIWEGARRASLTPKNLLVWDKGDGGIGSMFQQCHEMIWFFVPEPPQKAMKNARKAGHRLVLRSNILRYPRVTGDERKHNASKPVELCRELIRRSTIDGEIVLDLFGGAGSTLIACEREERAWRGVEITPKWCDVIVQRWEETTGEKAKRRSR